MQRQGGNVRNLGGKPFGFIGATGVRKPTTHLDLRAYHDMPHYHAMGYAHAISIRSLRKLATHFASLHGSRLIASARNIDLKTPLWIVWALELKGWPIDGFDNCSG